MNIGMNVHDNPLFEGNGGSIQTCTAHLEFPKFNGTDPSGWIYKAQKFFLYYQTPPQHKLLISSIYMEGRALAWYMLMENSKELTSWEAFTRALEIRFGLSPYNYDPCYCDPVEALIKLTQTSSVEKFQSHFERLANRTKGLPAAFMISCFINGLREEIGVTVKMFKPTTLSCAFELARMQEEESMRIEGNTSNPAVTSKSYIPVQRISLAQMKERRDRGLEFGNQEEENDQGTETNFY